MDADGGEQSGAHKQARAGRRLTRAIPHHPIADSSRFGSGRDLDDCWDWHRGIPELRALGHWPLSLQCQWITLDLSEHEWRSRDAIGVEYANKKRPVRVSPLCPACPGGACSDATKTAKPTFDEERHMAIVEHGRRCIRRAVMLVPPIKRVFSQRDSLLQEVQSLRRLLQQSQLRFSNTTDAARSDGEYAVISAMEPLMFRPSHALDAVPGIATGDTCDDAHMVQRVLKAYSISVGAEAAVAPSAIWKTIFDERQLPIHETIVKGDVAAVTRLLRRPGDTNLFFGFDGLVSEYVQYNNSSAFSLSVAKLCKDHLIRVAENMGALRYENPEALHAATGYGLMPTDDVLACIERVLDCGIRFPNPFSDELGVQTRHGVASYRAVHAIYQAWRIRELVRGIEKPRVLELGGGLGRTAYYARQLGVEDYTIIDLPFTGFSQGYFLMRTLGEEQVVLQGESQGDTSPGKIKILNPSAFLEGPQRYDLIVNVDSLTEMDRRTAERYWNRIQTATRTLLSINHESNVFTVKELIGENAGGVTSVERHPYGIRRGYVEELVSIDGS